VFCSRPFAFVPASCHPMKKEMILARSIHHGGPENTEEGFRLRALRALRGKLITDVVRPVGPDLVSGRKLPVRPPTQVRPLTRARPDTRSGPTGRTTSVNKHSIFGCGFAALGPSAVEAKSKNSPPKNSPSAVRHERFSHLVVRFVQDSRRAQLPGCLHIDQYYQALMHK
jgi:hypothetical protein